jgi:hypothetical protein
MTRVAAEDGNRACAVMAGDTLAVLAGGDLALVPVSRVVQF